MIRSLRRSGLPIVLAIASIVTVSFVVFQYAGRETQRSIAVRAVLRQPSDIKLTLEIRRDTGPVASESWNLRDRDGTSSATYAVTGRGGETIRTISQPHATTDVSFLFGLVVMDKIWDLPSRPPRGDTSVHYVFTVYQEVDGKHGSHTFELTDPHYWATTGGHQMQIHLDRNTDVRDSFLNVTSTVVVEPAYEKLVADFEAFGSPDFRAKADESRMRIERAGASPHA